MLEVHKPSVRHTPLPAWIAAMSRARRWVPSHVSIAHLQPGEIVEVKIGPFGLGKHLHVPAEEVDGVTDAGLLLKNPKWEFHEVGLEAQSDDVSA